jgi:protein tyrosine/serine phosphatase
MIYPDEATRRFPRFGSILLVLTLALAATTVAGQALAPVPTRTTATTVTLENFGKVNEQYYRGAQPHENEIEQLKRLGIKTIIDLRQDKEPHERDWASRAGIHYFNIPLKTTRAATDEQSSVFMSLVNDPANWPVYVHCKGGRHRTGALTAIYRITHDGWTAEQAFAEMKRYDFDHGFFGGPSAQKKFVFSFYERFLSHHTSR